MKYIYCTVCRDICVYKLNDKQSITLASNPSNLHRRLCMSSFPHSYMELHDGLIPAELAFTLSDLWSIISPIVRKNANFLYSRTRNLPCLLPDLPFLLSPDLSAWQLPLRFGTISKNQVHRSLTFIETFILDGFKKL